jgi:hypothetical protein
VEPAAIRECLPSREHQIEQLLDLVPAAVLVGDRQQHELRRAERDLTLLHRRLAGDPGQEPAQRLDRLARLEDLDHGAAAAQPRGGPGGGGPGGGGLGGGGLGGSGLGGSGLGSSGLGGSRLGGGGLGGGGLGGCTLGGSCLGGCGSCGLDLCGRGPACDARNRRTLDGDEFGGSRMPGCGWRRGGSGGAGLGRGTVGRRDPGGGAMAAGALGWSGRGGARAALLRGGPVLRRRPSACHDPRRYHGALRADASEISPVGRSNHRARGSPSSGSSANHHSRACVSSKTLTARCRTPGRDLAADPRSPRGS